MIARPKPLSQLRFYSSFEEQINHRHPLYILANRIDWKKFDGAFAKQYAKEDRSAKLSGLMAALLILKYLQYQQ